ncbi:MAG TPA: hypothetical protein VJW20_03885 [Candidatus Angelobacter sp.]|nr:hypothetical protein [Candidatus Angelobacter sp.]
MYNALAGSKSCQPFFLFAHQERFCFYMFPPFRVLAGQTGLKLFDLLLDFPFAVADSHDGIFMQ